MTTDCMFELQKAVYATLSGDATLTNMVTGVFSHVPERTTFPYIVLGEADSQDFSTKTSIAEMIIMPVLIFSRVRGSKEALDIMARVKELLNQAALVLVGCSLVNMRFISAEITQTKETLTWEGNVTFRAIVEAM